MIEPAGDSLRSGMARRVTSNVPLRLTARTASHSLAVVLVHRGGRPGDAGVVDEHVEAPELAGEILEHRGDGGRVRDVTDACR